MKQLNRPCALWFALAAAPATAQDFLPPGQAVVWQASLRRAIAHGYH